MVTYEDVTELFLNAAEATGLSIHPEAWLNTQTLEREFACTIHAGPCEEADQRATCTVSFAWGPLDTVLSIDGAEGICDFFHEPDEKCTHLHTEDVPPLAFDLTYAMPMEGAAVDVNALQTFARTIKLRASEHSGRAVETRPSIGLTFGEHGLEVESLTLQQRVELPLWDPEGVNGLRASENRREGHLSLGRGRPRRDSSGDYDTDAPHPEEWLPHLFAEVMADISGVIAALESVHAFGYAGGASDTNQTNSSGSNN